MSAAVTLPAGPLLDLARRIAAATDWTDPDGPNAILRTPTSVHRLAELMGCHTRTVCRIITAGEVSIRLADRYAVALGSHPALIWPDWWTLPHEDDDADDLEAVS